VLDELAGRAILLDIESEDGITYVLPPPRAKPVRATAADMWPRKLPGVNLLCAHE
jgi:hypothetical protein